ncbi:nuclear transport factor 2 family protein [Dokdonella sp.]|uniref:nuclear transport factor 2 family protein n=1 Tax=Dokdonella sp. TaxID=2291710 RepID=UPI00260766C7|nr:nuclear transport factor 2 family protein [Dokdonella sp.]
MRVLSLLLLVLTLSACARVPDADAIRDTIRTMATAAEAKRSGDVLERIADDFTGNDGELDREGLERLLRARLFGGQAIGVSIGRIDVELDGDRATARFPMTVTDDSGRWLPDRRAELDVTTGWRRKSGTWSCYNARWSNDSR